MIQLPYGAVSILGLGFFYDKIEISSILERDLDLLEELEEKEKEIEVRSNLAETLQPWNFANGFEIVLGHLETFFPSGSKLLRDIPPEI